jgi:hypothetical protein
MDDEIKAELELIARYQQALQQWQQEQGSVPDISAVQLAHSALLRDEIASRFYFDQSELNEVIRKGIENAVSCGLPERSQLLEVIYTAINNALEGNDEWGTQVRSSVRDLIETHLERLSECEH